MQHCVFYLIPWHRTVYVCVCVCRVLAKYTSSDMHVQITFMECFVCDAQATRQTVYMCALCTSRILPNRFTFWNLLERKMNQNISWDPVEFLPNMNYKSTSCLVELVISLPQNIQIFSHICALYLRAILAGYTRYPKHHFNAIYC